MQTKNAEKVHPDTVSDEIINIVIEPKLHIVAMPKAGTHALANIARTLAAVWVNDEKIIQWCGSFLGDGWHTKRKPIDNVVAAIMNQPRGTFLQGHLAPDQEVREALWESNTSVVFLLRDLRDIAVSQAYHMLTANQDQRMRHPHPELFHAMGSFEEILIAVIKGVEDPNYELGYWPGLIERWELYEPWRGIDWAWKIRFEDLIDDFEEAVGGMIRYVIGYHVYRIGKRASIDEKTLDELVASARMAFGMKQQSPTFRRGKPGGWKDDFTPLAVKAFDEVGGSDWLIELAYERDKSWMDEWV